MGFPGNNAARTPVKYDPKIHRRRSIRLRGHDYAGRGMYFLTIRVERGASGFSPPLFGTVVNGRMALNDAGRAAAVCWRAIPKHFPHAALDEWIIMPDHVHGIIVIRRDGHPAPAGANNHSPLPGSPIRPTGTSRTIGSIVRGFKIGVTKSLGGKSPWQRNYYDIIVRDQPALNNIRAYIRNNPANWNVHRYGKPRFFAGNRALLDMPMTAFLASRRDVGGDVAAGHDGKGEKSFAPNAMVEHGAGEKSFAPTDPTRWPTRPECVVSGFLSPMERAVFDACLDRDIPMVRIMARGLPECFPQCIQRAIDTERLLVMTPFDASVDRYSAGRAAWCNQYALHLAANAVIGHLAPDGMLTCLLADLHRDIPVQYLESQPVKEGIPS